MLSSHQVDLCDPHSAAEVLLKIASLYSEEPETKTAVLETFGNFMLTQQLNTLNYLRVTSVIFIGMFCIVLSYHRCCVEEAALCFSLPLVLLPLHTAGHDGTHEGTRAR